MCGGGLVRTATSEGALHHRSIVLTFASMSLPRRIFPFVVTETECTCYVCGKKGTATTLYHKEHLTTSIQPPAGWWVMPDDLVVFDEDHEDDDLPGLLCSVDCAAKAEWANRGVW